MIENNSFELTWLVTTFHIKVKKNPHNFITTTTTIKDVQGFGLGWFLTPFELNLKVLVWEKQT